MQAGVSPESVVAWVCLWLQKKASVAGVSPSTLLELQYLHL